MKRMMMVLLLGTACGGGLDKGSKNNASNSTPNNAENSQNSGTAECGNGVLEPGETCDGDCPTQCPTTNACEPGRLSGSAESCNVVCDTVPVTLCVAGDACCPATCTEDEDADCIPGCGNGILEAGELCDGDCPTSCEGSNACEVGALSGDPAMCTSMCTFATISVCQGGDGCCPAGCTDANDTDCNCTPLTCQDVGAECGSIDDGCASTVACVNTCAPDETCVNNQCVPASGNGAVGDACVNDLQCQGFTNAYCEMHPDFFGGYCTAACQFDNDCPMGSHCARLFAGDPAQQKICMKNCTSNAQCRASGYACQNWDSFDQNAQPSDECGPAATGAGDIGEACAGIADCMPDLECARTVSTQTMGQVTFPGGMCTASCIPILLGCPAGFVCSDSSYCMPECVSSLQCRTGYSCITASFEMRNHCWPS